MSFNSVRFIGRHIYKEGKVYKGIIGSSDIWNREKDKLIYLTIYNNLSFLLIKRYTRNGKMNIACNLLANANPKKTNANSDFPLIAK